MTKATALRPGDTVTATVDDTTGTTVTADLTVILSDRLGCGCWRYTCQRPGPAVTGACRSVQVLTGCGRHPSDTAGGLNG
ncbi:hypothetical protein [Verrucosispora sp. WMMC514]|uniref:hypothetical protein n=1 Tax=Verrucosispora sp. WMMC514 TaxID=3015156 RepID=UPI00248C7954|nr:hypothetical protein [Verrucosispora sp. WMMC514]WBB94099.1 hypothetical protein O7597_14555 [Verrucosispora sp. WMMC514]